MANIGIIKNNLKVVKQDKLNNDNNLAKTYDLSILYKKDIEDSLILLKELNTSLNKFKNSISNITNWIKSDSITEFNNVKSKLQELNNNIDCSVDTDKIINKIKVASNEVYEEFKEQYKNNYSNFDLQIESVEKSIVIYERLELKINDLRSELNKIDITLEQKNNINNHILEYSSRKNQIYNSCVNMISTMKKENENNIEILEKGLKMI